MKESGVQKMLHALRMGLAAHSEAHALIEKEKGEVGHDFDKLRAERNASVAEQMKKFAEEHGVSVDSLQSTFDPNSCYCACGTGGPCEHRWDGPIYESSDHSFITTTCSRCGMSAMSHDVRYGP